MATADFTSLEEATQSSELWNALEEIIRESNDPHRQFDARLLKKKHQLGVPLWKPTSFEDVPSESRNAFEEEYIAAAREAGLALLEQDRLREAFMYLRAIREFEPLARKLEQSKPPLAGDEGNEELLHLALGERVHPELGTQWMLKSHGTCSTITALDQHFPHLTAAQRSACAAVMVRHLYEDLVDSVRRDVTKRRPLISPKATLTELIAEGEAVLAEGNYHIDVSHLHSVVRFGRSLDADRTAELRLVDELALYGSRLNERLQYPGDPPFEEFYIAHRHFFGVLLDRDREAGLAYFRSRIEGEADPQDRALTAYVLVDLFVRIGRDHEAILVAENSLLPVDEDFLPAFAELCEKTGDWAPLKRIATERQDPLLVASIRLINLKSAAN